MADAISRSAGVGWRQGMCEASSSARLSGGRPRRTLGAHSRPSRPIVRATSCTSPRGHRAPPGPAPAAGRGQPVDRQAKRKSPICRYFQAAEGLKRSTFCMASSRVGPGSCAFYLQMRQLRALGGSWDSSHLGAFCRGCVNQSSTGRSRSGHRGPGGASIVAGNPITEADEESKLRLVADTAHAAWG